MRRTKIVATIGPASREPETLRALIRAGVDVVRLNFSHGTREAKLATIRDVRDAAEAVGRPVAILQDLAGPKIRIGVIEHGPVALRPGSLFTLTARDVPGTEHEVSLVYKGLPEDVEAGDVLMLADGALQLVVERVDGPDIVCRVVVGGALSSNKGINLPSGTIKAPILDDKDLADLRFGLEHGVDYVALSFVRTAADVQVCLDAMDAFGLRRPLIAKIEQREGIVNIAAILPLVDALMVARGDLGVEIPPEEVPCHQKALIAAANAAGKPVITATQMLRSMVESPLPTRAEVSDVYNAILDGSDAVMLSEETAVGRYPEAAVLMMARIARRAEAALPYGDRLADRTSHGALCTDEAVAHAACQTAAEIGAAAIVTLTKSGSTTRLVSKYRPRQPVLALTDEAAVCRRLALVWGAVPVHSPHRETLEDYEVDAVRQALDAGLCRPGDSVVVTAGLPLHEPGRTNLIKVLRVPG
jgi:pyruvate kinase